jgi:hypothetical protein
VAIHRLLQHSVFGPDDIDRIVRAYEDAARTASRSNRPYRRDCRENDHANCADRSARPDAPAPACAQRTCAFQIAAFSVAGVGLRLIRRQAGNAG